MTFATCYIKALGNFLIDNRILFDSCVIQYIGISVTCFIYKTYTRGHLKSNNTLSYRKKKDCHRLVNHVHLAFQLCPVSHQIHAVLHLRTARFVIKNLLYGMKDGIYFRFVVEKIEIIQRFNR